ncbi:MAG TPA: hypothetical protein DEP42_03040 [Ruminococcaceae bacterium]|nr:hypothetical protein [Oscillospiraceae bacterium]
MKTKVITFASYKIALEFSGVDAEKLRKSFQKLIALPELLMEKKTKRAVRMIDIHPWFEKAEPIFEENLLELKAILPAGQMETINPNCFTAILEQYVQLKPDLDHICRTGIFNEQMQSFH